MHYAGFFTRFIACIIDALVFLFVFAVTGFFTKFIEAMHGNFFAGYLTRELGVFATVIAWLYFALMESSKYQATVGKMILGIKVTDLEGNRIDFLKSTLRFFSKYISGFILMLGYIMALFTKKKQALHDIIAGCVVIARCRDRHLESNGTEQD